MSTDATNQPMGEVPSAEVCAQAAAWIARLHGETRTVKVEAGFRRWLAENPAHRAAFEMATDVWGGAERWPKPKVTAFRRSARFEWTTPRTFAAAAGLMALTVAGGMLYLNHDRAITTTVGEQRSFTLDDGTRILLNTATRIRLDYDQQVRRVHLDSGEAIFDVARRPNWPFMVTAGGKQITALGTAFLVRRDDRQVAVLLMEGKVAVESVATQAQPSPVEMLAPGQRLTFTEAATPKRDRPPLEKVTAWQRNQVMLDHTPLSEAVREMNRYSPMPLAIESPPAAEGRVAGVFRAGDVLSFAHAVAEAYRLQVTEYPKRISISGVPVPPRD